MVVDVALDGDDALARLGANRYDVVVLDRDLPGTHGDEICRSLAAERCESRVLMLTAASSVRDRVEGLGLGADDYLPKPFDFAELVARVQALGRRPGAPKPERLGYRDLTLDPERRVAVRAGRRLALSPKEFAVLECLLAAEGTPVSAEELLERVWDEATDPFTTTVNATINRLRAKLGDPPIIQTVRERGYRIGGHDARSHRPGSHDPSWLRLPRRTARLRLTALYGGLFLLSGVALLAAPTSSLNGRPNTRRRTCRRSLTLPPSSICSLAERTARFAQCRRAAAGCSRHCLRLSCELADQAQHPLAGPGPLHRPSSQLPRDQHQLAQAGISWHGPCISWHRSAPPKPRSAPPTRTSCWSTRGSRWRSSPSSRSSPAGSLPAGCCDRSGPSPAQPEGSPRRACTNAWRSTAPTTS